MTPTWHALHRIRSVSTRWRRLTLHLVAAGVVLLALIPRGQPATAHADAPNPCSSTILGTTSTTSAGCTPPDLLNLNQTLYTATISQTQSLGNLEAQAVTNIIKGRSLPAGDANAVLSWGRADAEAELYDLLLRAIATDPVSRTVDQQNVVDWMSTVAQRKAVQAAQDAGLEYVKWAGLSQLAYQNLVDSHASQSTLQTFLCGGDCTASTAIVNPAGFCNYRPPAPYQGDYNDSADRLCMAGGGGLGCTLNCLPPTPSYDQFTKWGEADANYALLNSSAYLTSAQQIAIGLGISLPLAAYQSLAIPVVVIADAVRSLTALDALSAQATADAAAAGTFGRTAAQAATAAANAAKAAAAAQGALSSIRLFAVIGGALVVIEVLGNLASAILQGIAVFNAAALPGQLASLIANAATTPPDLTALESSSAGGTSLFDLFVGATLPTPLNETCDNALIPPALYGAGYTWISPTGAFINTVPCLNPTPIPPASAGDPQFVVQAPGGTTSGTSPTITWKDQAAGTTTTARLSTNWFVEQVSGSTAQTQALHITYTDWAGTEQTAWLVGDPTDGYAFLTVASASTTVDPATCVAAGTCSYGTSIDYVDGNGTDLSASVQAPAPNGQVPGQLAPGTVSGDNPTGSPLVSTHTCSAAFEGCPVEFYVNTFGPLDAFNFLGQITSPMTYTWEFQQTACNLGCIPVNGAGPDYTAPITSNGTTDYYFPTSGTFAVRLTATDANGKQAVDTFSIFVGEVPPTLALNSACPLATPCDTRTAQVGTALSLAGTLTHAGSQDVENVHVNWGDGSVDSAYCGYASLFNTPPGSGCGAGTVPAQLNPSEVPGPLTLTPDASQTHVALSDSHTYARGGTYYVTVWVSDQSGRTDSQTIVETVANPAPTTRSLDLTSAPAVTCGPVVLPTILPPAPAVAAIGSSPVVTVTGSGFVPDSLVQWNGTPLATTYVSPCQLTAQVPATATASATVGTLSVANAAPGGGTSNAQILFVGSLAGAGMATSTDAGGSATATVGGHSNLIGGIGLPGTPGTLSATASGGAGTVAVGQYTADPLATTPPAAVNAYFDLFTTAGSSFGSVQVTDCNLGSGSVVYYYDATSNQWTAVSGQSYDAGSGCVSFTLSAFSMPSLIQLSGTDFGVGHAPPTLANPGPQSVPYGGQVSIPVSATDQEAADKLTLHASGLPAGLSLTDNGDGTGTVSGVVTAAVGPYTATVSANDGYGDATPVTVPITVTPASLTITAGSPSIVYNGTVPAITPSYSGFVNGESAAALTTPPTCTASAPSSGTVGTYTTTCTGAADPNYSIGYVPGTLTISKAATSVSLASVPASSVFGQSVTFTATVTVQSPGAGQPTGTVEFKDGGSDIGGCSAQLVSATTATATCTTSSLNVATHSLTASYSGDANFTASSTAAALAQTVNKAASSTTLGSAATAVTVGQPLTFTATLAAVAPGAGLPTGSVTFRDGATTLGSASLSTSGGVTTGRFSTSSLSVGTHAITAGYGGDGHFLASSAVTLTQYVNTNLSGYPKLASGAYNLANANLSGGYFVNAALAGASLSGSNLTNAVFLGANLTGANLSGSNYMGGTTFTNATLTNANLSNSNLKGDTFTGATLSGANLSNSNLTGAKGLKTATLTNVVWSKTVCPDGTLSSQDGGTCLGHL